MGEKRHFEPVKRAEPRFPENPTNHSSPPARRRQKIAPPPPFIPTPPPFSHAPPSSDLIRSLRLPHTLTILPHPPLSCRHRSDDVKHHHPPNLVHIPCPPSSCAPHMARHRRAPPSFSPPPSLVDPPPQFVQSEFWQNTQTAQSRHYSHHLNIFLRIVCRVFLLPQPPCRFAGRHYQSQASRMCSTRHT